MVERTHVVVHQFRFNGVDYQRSDVLDADVADALLSSKPHLLKTRCRAVNVELPTRAAAAKTVSNESAPAKSIIDPAPAEEN